jgi:hypothetical protein
MAQMTTKTRKRVEGWEDRLFVVIEEHARQPFQWGVSDCCTFPMDVCRALIGIVPEKYVPGSYDDMQSAVRELKAHGYRHLGEAFADAFVEIPPAFAGRGDLGQADYPGAILGGGVVVIGEEVLGKGELGLVRVPRNAMSRAFRIG